MEVSAEEMVKMFDLHKDRAWSFHLEPMGERRYPRTVGWISSRFLRGRPPRSSRPSRRS